MIVLKRILYLQVFMYPAAILFALELMDVIRFWIRSVEGNLMDLLLALISIIFVLLSLYPAMLLYNGEETKSLRIYIKCHYLMYSLPSLLYLYKEFRQQTTTAFLDSSNSNEFKPDGILPRLLWFCLSLEFLLGVQLAVHFLFQLVRHQQSELPGQSNCKVLKYIKHGFLPWIDLKKLLYLQMILALLYSPMGSLRFYGKLTSGIAAEKLRVDTSYLINHSGMIIATFGLWFGVPCFYQGIKQGNTQKLKYYLIIKSTGHVIAGIFFFALTEIEENISREHEPILLKIFTIFYTMWGATEISQVITMIHQLQIHQSVNVNNLHDSTLTKMTNGVNWMDMHSLNASDNAIGSSSEFIDELEDYNFLKIPKQFRIRPKRLKVEMINSNCIGSGQYGRVWKGHLTTQSYPVKKTLPIAMKIIDDGLTSGELRSSVVSEVMAMVNAGSHENLVKLFGVCKDTRKRQLGIILELCELGNLKAFLQKSDEFHKEDSKISIDLLNKWAYEVALGMEYLSSKNIIHGDVALRNILLDDQHKVKISDFGMSIKLYNYQRYARSTMQVFPWRGMSPESLCDLKFSTESDIWAFGILLFELYSFGRTPWAGLTWSSDFIRQLESGIRLERPQMATERIYTEVMKRCWQIKPSDRIPFKEIVEFFKTSSSSMDIT